MGKLKISNKCGNYPLPPTKFEFKVQLIGDAIKITTDDDTNIKIKGIDMYERRRNQTKLILAADLIYDNLIIEKKKEDN